MRATGNVVTQPVGLGLDEAFWGCIDTRTGDSLKGLPAEDEQAVRAALVVIGLDKSGRETAFPSADYLHRHLGSNNPGAVVTMLAAHHLENRPLARVRQGMRLGRLVGRGETIELTTPENNLQRLAGRLALREYSLQRVNVHALPALLYGVAIKRCMRDRQIAGGEPNPYVYPRLLGLHFRANLNQATWRLLQGSVAPVFADLYRRVAADPRLKRG